MASVKQEMLGQYLDDLRRADRLGWGWGSIKRGLRSSITAPFKAVKYSFTVPYRASKAYITNKQLKGASDLTHFSGDAESPEIQERQAARKILDGAAQAKTISRTDLKKAIWLYAGKQSTETERTAVGSKMLDFLNKRQVKLIA